MRGAYRVDKRCQHERVIETTEPWQPPCPYAFQLRARVFQCVDCGGDVDGWTVKDRTIPRRAGPTWPDVVADYFADPFGFDALPSAVCMNCADGASVCYVAPR